MLDTPIANRIHIGFFGRMNAGKSTLVNEFCGQNLAIVSPTPGTTTDPVSKAMEILPLGPCLITDTAGIDDEGELGAQRVAKTMAVLEKTDIAVWVGENPTITHPHLIEYHRGDSVEELKKKIAAIKLDEEPGLLEGLVKAGDKVTLVCPIDGSAPKGRLILPQVQVLRECLDRHVIATVCQPSELDLTNPPELIITDSQAFNEVDSKIRKFENSKISLTSFSILFARQKGDLEEFKKGLEAVKNLKDGDTILIAEGCTHHRQCNDIGSVKIPKAVEKLSGKKLNFVFTSGADFPQFANSKIALVIHCGGCMLTRRMMLARIARCKAAGVPIVNYGILLQEVLCAK